MPGPLPQEHRRRRNAPTIPTTSLPVGGRTGRPPNPPDFVELGEAGRAFWRWAWTTPQAAAWSKGHHSTLAHRASLEDDLHALTAYDDGIDLVELLSLDGDPAKAAREISERINYLIGKLKAAAGGKASIISRIQAYDAQIGLDPKGMAALRWKIVAEEEPELISGGAVEEDGVTFLDRWRERA